jgi:hypothetical protein
MIYPLAAMRVHRIVAVFFAAENSPPTFLPLDAQEAEKQTCSKCLAADILNIKGQWGFRSMA